MNSKHKALHKVKEDKSQKDAHGIPLYKMPHYKAHKAVGGKIYFMTEKHPEQIKHREHEALLESRKESYRKSINRS